MATKKPKKESATLRKPKKERPEYPNLFASDELENVDAIFREIGEQYLGGMLSAHKSELPQFRLHHAAILKRFSDRVFAGEEVDPFILKFLARAFEGVLHGMHWDEEIYLPGRELPAEFYMMHDLDRRDLQLHRKVAFKVEEGIDVTKAIEAVAQDQNHSNSTVRSAYYVWKIRWEDVDRSFNDPSPDSKKDPEI